MRTSVGLNKAEKDLRSMGRIKEWLRGLGRGDKGVLRLRGGGKFGPPVVMGDESIMSKKAHGTTESGVQQSLKYKVDNEKADEICCFNRHWAEHSGYFLETSWLDEVGKQSGPAEYYDSVSGKLLFTAPRERSFAEFLEESKHHGWPSFRDSEVNWKYVRVLEDGETVSVDGTHLGHNIPDSKGNRYCINLVSVAGYPTEVSGLVGATAQTEKTFKLLKNNSGCTGMFFRPDPRKGKPKAAGASNWPRDGALLKGHVHEVNGDKWLECTQVKQAGKSWEKVKAGNWMPFAYAQYYLEEA